MLDNPKWTEYIHWLPDGLSFIIPNTMEFAKHALAAVMKHSNVSTRASKAWLMTQKAH